MGYGTPAVGFTISLLFATVDLLVVMKAGLKNDYRVSVNQIDKSMLLIYSP
jgi:hypothetical protein